MTDNPSETTRLTHSEAVKLGQALDAEPMAIPALTKILNPERERRETCEDMALPAAWESVLAARDAAYALADLDRMPRD